MIVNLRKELYKKYKQFYDLEMKNDNDNLKDEKIKLCDEIETLKVKILTKDIKNIDEIIDKLMNNIKRSKRELKLKKVIINIKRYKN